MCQACKEVAGPSDIYLSDNHQRKEICQTEPPAPLCRLDRQPTLATLIVVAGMNYAAYVQRKGYDVLTSSELLAEQLVRQLKLNAKITHLQ